MEHDDTPLAIIGASHRLHPQAAHRPPAPAHRRAHRSVSADDAGTGPASAIQGTITTVHQYELPLPRAEAWRLISEVSQYRTWWPWLRSFEGVRARVGRGVALRGAATGAVPRALPRVDRARRAGRAGASQGRRGRRGQGDVDAQRHGYRVRGHPGQLAGAWEHGRSGWSPVLPHPSPVSATTGSSIRVPANSSPVPSNPSWATRHTLREILDSPDPRLHGGRRVRCRHRVGLRGQGDHRRRRHRLGSGHHGHRFRCAVDRAGPPGRQAGGGPGARDLDLVAQARGHRGERSVDILCGRHPRRPQRWSGGRSRWAAARPRRSRWHRRRPRRARPSVWRSRRPPIPRPPSACGPPPRRRATQIARRTTPQGFSWRAIAGTVAIVFVLALLFITAVELISGKPLSAIFGGADTGTTLKNIVNPSPAPTTTPTSTTSTTSTTGTSSSTTTTTAGATTTTSTSAPKGSVTTTTPTTAPTTTTNTSPGQSGSTTTTSVSSAP